MGILLHTDIERALDVALSADIPFWPELAKVSSYEDMCVQALESSPGVRMDAATRRYSLVSPVFMMGFLSSLKR